MTSDFLAYSLDRRPKRAPVSFGQVTDPKPFSGASDDIVGTNQNLIPEFCPFASPLACWDDDGGRSGRYFTAVGVNGREKQQDRLRTRQAEASSGDQLGPLCRNWC